MTPKWDPHPIQGPPGTPLKCATVCIFTLGTLKSAQLYAFLRVWPLGAHQGPHGWKSRFFSHFWGPSGDPPGTLLGTVALKNAPQNPSRRRSRKGPCPGTLQSVKMTTVTHFSSIFKGSQVSILTSFRSDLAPKATRKETLGQQKRTPENNTKFWCILGPGWGTGSL